METPEKESTSTWKTNHDTRKVGSKVGGTKGTLLWIALGVMLEMFDLFKYGAELTSSLAEFWSELTT